MQKEEIYNLKKQEEPVVEQDSAEAKDVKQVISNGEAIKESKIYVKEEVSVKETFEKVDESKTPKVKDEVMDIKTEEVPIKDKQSSSKDNSKS